MSSEQNAADQWRPDSYWDGGGEGNFVEGYTRGIGMAPGASPEVLPGMADGEVEIVLIRMRSVLGDLMSLRVRREDGRLCYRMVDEYEWSCDMPSPQCEQPLTFGELVGMLKNFRMSEHDGLFFPSGWDNCMESFDLIGGWDGVCEFYVVESDFYDGLQDWYLEQFEQWAVAKRAEWDEDE
jgi:hypothetical protein